MKPKYRKKQNEGEMSASASTSTRLTKSTKLSGDSSSSTARSTLKEVLPKKGYLHCEDSLTFVLCKPKLLPLKSYTLEKLEKIQSEAIEKAKQDMNAASLD